MKRLLSILIALLIFAYPVMAEEEPEIEYRMSGLVTGVSDGSFTIQWADGYEYTFHTNDKTDMGDLDGELKTGDTAFIIYTKDIDWENRDALGVNVEYVSYGEMDEIEYISGVVADASMHNLTINWVNGREYSFFTGDEVDKSGISDGITIGNVVKLGYIGMIDWETDDNMGIHIVSISDGEVETVNEITGKVYDATMHNIVVETSDGELYAFSDNGDVDKSGLSNGIAIDEIVKVSFVGSLENIDYAHLIAIADA